MKKRILSLLLLVVMLVTMIPVSSVAAEATEGNAAASTAKNYNSLYAAQENLTALYTLLDDGATVDLETGIWAPTIGSKNATLGNHTTADVNVDWVTGYKSVGITQIWGSYIDGVFSEESEYNNNDVLGTRLQFGTTQDYPLPAGDYTLEYVAGYRNIMAVDANGKPVIAGVDIPGTTDNYLQGQGTFSPYGSPYGSSGTYASDAVDMIGALASYTTQRDGVFYDGSNPGYYGTALGGVVWKIYNAPHASLISTNGWRLLMYSHVKTNAWNTRNQIRTYTVLRDKYAVDSGTTDETTGDPIMVNKATYTLVRDRVEYAVGSNADATFGDGRDGSWYFYLGERLSADYFVVRIYDKLLSADEQTQNHAIDVAMYYELELPENLAEDADSLKLVINTLKDVAFESDATAIASKKAELTSALNEALYRFENYAAPANLVAFYSAMEKDHGIDLSTGTWKSLVGEGVATFGNYDHELVGQRWVRSGKSVGITQIWGSYIDGVYEPTSEVALANNTNDVLGTRLEFGLGQLPADDFTVEYLAQYRWIQAVDADGNPVVASKDVGVYGDNNDAQTTGSNFSPFDSSKYGWLGPNATTAVDYIGNLSSYTSQRDNTFMAPSSYGWAGNNMYGHVGWKVERTSSANVFTLSSYNRLMVTKPEGGHLPNIYQTRDQVRTYAITRTEFDGFKADGTTANRNATYTLIRDGEVYHSHTANHIDFSQADLGQFYIGERLSMDFYAVRIYDKVLSAEELAQNRKMDIVNYYGVTIPEEFLQNKEELAKALNAIASIAGNSFATDASVIAVKSASMQKVFDDKVSLGAAELYVQDGLTSLFTAFASNSSVDIANKTWNNRIFGQANATLYQENEAFAGGYLWKDNTATGGGIGVSQIYGTVTYNEDKTAATLTAANAANTDGAGQVRLQLDLSLLPKADYTLEYVAHYTPNYAIDGETGAKVDIYREKTENGLALTGNGRLLCNNGGSGTPIDAVGLFTSWSSYAGYHSYTAGFSVNNVAWRALPRTSWGWNGVCGTGNGLNSVNRNAGKIAVYGMVRDETVDNADVARASMKLFFDGTQEASYSYDSGVGSTAPYKYYKQADEDGTDFFLSNRISTDFYALRIYNRILTTNEMVQNRAVDVILFYNIELDEDILANEELLTKVYAALSSADFVEGADAQAAKKAELKAAIRKVVDKFYSDAGTEKLYVQDGLQILYTAMLADNGIDMEAGTWKSIVGGKTATFGNIADAKVGKRWVQGSKSVGITQTWGSYIDGVYDPTSEVALANNTNDVLGTRLEFGLDQLPADDFTVEYLAQYRWIQAVDANGDPVVASKDVGVYDYNDDARTQGSNFSAFDQNTYSWLGANATTAVDYIGNLSSYASQRDNTFMHPSSYGWADNNMYGHVGWKVERSSGANVFTLSSYNRLMVTKPEGGHLANVYQTRDQIRTYTITRDEFDGFKADGTTANRNATYTLIRDGEVYHSHTANHIDFSLADLGQFYIGERLSMDFYSVRIYNRVLTAAEQQRNHMADIVSYYDVTLPTAVLRSPELLDQLTVDFASMGFATDITEISKTSAQIQATVDNLATTRDALALYVSDGLVGNFTALTAADATASLATGTWANRVSGGLNATFGNKALWKKNANGSVGVTQIYGSYFVRGEDEEATWSEESDFNTNLTKGTRLEFSLSMLPSEDYTIEYVAEYRNIMSVDADGNIVGTMNDLGGKTPYTLGEADAYAPVDQFGYLTSWTTNRDSYHSTYSGLGLVAWFVSGVYDGSNSYVGAISKGFSPVLFKNGEVYHTRNLIKTYVITRDMTIEGEGDGATYTARYAIGKDGVESYSYTDTKLGAKYATENTSDRARFYIGERLSVDFYAVRVYSKVLTAKEQLQNHMADIVFYYGLELPEGIADDAAAFDKVILAMRKAEIVTDNSLKAAKKAEYTKLIADALAEEEITAIDYDSLYVQNGLVGLYSAFAGDTSIDLFEGTWQNKVEGGAAATIKGIAGWDRSTVGIGFTMNYDQWKAGSAGLGISLPDTFENLENFTVEAFATVKGITEGGLRYTHSTTYNANPSAFRFGLLASVFFQTIASHPSENISNRWMAYNSSFPNRNPTMAQDKGYVIQRNIVDAFGNPTTDASDRSWTNGASVQNPVPNVMQVVKTTAKDGDTVTDVSFAIYYNGDETAVQSTTIASATYNEMLAVTCNDTAGRFSLFNGTPSDVYAIRVYDRELTAAEKLQNSFVDKAAYYRIDVTGFENLEDAEKLAMYEKFADVSLTLAPAQAQAIYKFYANDDASGMAETMIEFDEYQPIKSGAYGYRVLFTLNMETLALLESVGYDVAYGAVLAAGGSYHDVADLAVTFDGEKVTAADDMAVIQVGGAAGTRVFYDYPGSNVKRFSAAVTTDNSAYFGTDIIVRGYVALKKGNETIYAYIDVYQDNVFDGEVSIADVADYYVNHFEGNPADMYAYMNSQALRYILSECGMSAYRNAPDDIVLYVDGVNGSDENSGLAEDQAFKTLDAAYAATLAHFNTAGMKGVTLVLAEGTIFAKETFRLNKNELLADDCYLNVIGAGADLTTLSGEVEIPGTMEAGTTQDFGADYVQISQNADGSYPNFRTVYGYANGERVLLDLVHNGDEEQIFMTSGLIFVDAQGNELTGRKEFVTETNSGTDTNDWLLTDEDAEKAVYAIYSMPASMFVKGYDYKDTELHMIVRWGEHVFPIEKVVLADDSDVAQVYIDFNLFYGSGSRFNKAHDVAARPVWLENGYPLLQNNADTYFYNKKTGLLYYMGGEQYMFTFDKMTYAGLETMFDFENFNNISISGVTFTGLDSRYLNEDTAIATSQSAATVFYDRNGITSAQQFLQAGAIHAKHVDGMYISDIAVVDSMGGGVLADGIVKNVSVTGSRFENLGETAIRLGNGSCATSYVKNVDIRNNYINGIGSQYRTAVGINLTTAAHATVIGNTIMNVPYSGMTFGWWISGSNVTNLDGIGATGKYNLFALEIAYNYITDFMLCTEDGGAIYTVKNSTQNDRGIYLNYMHHNYVNISEQSGTHMDGRFFMGYYHDNTSSNWHDYENVLVNSMTGAFSHTMPIYNQDIVGARCFGNFFEHNYLIGFESIGTVYKAGADSFSNALGLDNVVRDYLFTSVANLKDGTSVVGQKISDAYDVETVEAPATAANDVAAIFAAAGSTYGKENKVSGLTWTAAAAERKTVLDYEKSDISVTGATAYTATFVNGDTQTATMTMAGSTLKVPGQYAREGASYIFTIGGEEIDPSTYIMPEENITVNVAVTMYEYTVTLTDGATRLQLTVHAGDRIELPEGAFSVEGHESIFTIDNEPIHLGTYTVPAKDITVRVGYEKKEYKITYVYEDGSKIEQMQEFDSVVEKPAEKDILGHKYVYYVDGKIVGLSAQKVPAYDLTIEVKIEPETYDVKFYYDDNADLSKATLYTTIQVVFGEEIVLPATPPSQESENYIYEFVRWIGYEEGMKLTTEGATFIMETNPVPKAPEFAVGDINGDGIVDVMDIAMLTAYCAETLADPSLVLGNTDVNEDGISDVMDIAALTAMCAK